MKNVSGSSQAIWHSVHSIVQRYHMLTGALIIITGLLTTNPLLAKNDLYYYKNIPYALCSHALCLDVTGDKKTAECLCPVISSRNEAETWKLDSVSPVESSKGLPQYSCNTGNLTSVLSTFSLANNDTYNPAVSDDSSIAFISCAGSSQVASQYADCFGVRCPVVNDTAHCQCPITESKKYNLGFTEDKFSQFCASGNVIWSGAAIEDGEKTRTFILNNYHENYGQ